MSVAHSDTSSDQYVVSCLQACLMLVHRPTGCSRDVPQPLCSPWGPHVCFRLSQCVHYFVNVVRVIAVRCGARGVAASALLRARSCSPARRVCGVLLLVAGGSWGLVLASKAQRISLWLCSSAPESNLKAPRRNRSTSNSLPFKSHCFMLLSVADRPARACGPILCFLASGILHSNLPPWAHDCA